MTRGLRHPQIAGQAVDREPDRRVALAAANEVLAGSTTTPGQATYSRAPRPALNAPPQLDNHPTVRLHAR
jgi:hypothetical protein